MEHAGNNSFFIHLQVRQDDPHPQGMDDVRLPGFPHLVFMRVFRDAVRLLHHGDVSGRMVFPDPCDQRLIELFRVLVILGRFNGMAVHDLKILIQLFILKCCCHNRSPFKVFPVKCLKKKGCLFSMWGIPDDYVISL